MWWLIISLFSNLGQTNVGKMMDVFPAKQRRHANHREQTMKILESMRPKKDGLISDWLTFQKRKGRTGKKRWFWRVQDCDNEVVFDLGVWHVWKSIQWAWLKIIESHSQSQTYEIKLRTITISIRLVSVQSENSRRNSVLTSEVSSHVDQPLHLGTKNGNTYDGFASKQYFSLRMCSSAAS